MVFVSALAVAVFRYCPKPPKMQNVDPGLGLFLLGCYLMGGAGGWVLPGEIAHALGVAWGDGALERTAKIFGAVGGFVIAVQGLVIWASILLLGFLGFGAMALFDFIFKR